MSIPNYTVMNLQAKPNHNNKKNNMKVTYTNAVTKVPGTTGPLEQNLQKLAPYAALTVYQPTPAPRVADVIQFPFAPL